MSNIKGIMKPDDEIITLEEVAKLTKFDKGYLKRRYNTWRSYGVRILKIAPNAKPRFYRSDILRMLEVQK